MPFNWLVYHALLNVWCTPDQDIQSIIQPARLTGHGGALKNAKILGRDIQMPDSKNRYHVYQIGQIHPLLLNLVAPTAVWTSFADNCNQRAMMVDIYTDRGHQLPRFETYFMLTDNRNLIMAVRKQTLIPFQFNDDAVYLRLYSNAYFNNNFETQNPLVRVIGKRITTNAELIQMQASFNAYKTLQGHVYTFINGYKQATLSPYNVAIGDVVELVYDSSIYKIVDFPITELKTFTSTLDNCYKYLLHYQGPDAGIIDYHDDIDVFLYEKRPNNTHRGVFFHKNDPRGISMRMVTHRDYSIPVSFVSSYLHQENWAASENIFVRLHIRRSGYQRPLVNENNRIKELYKLSEKDRLNAMLGLESVLPNWRAEVLEASAYTKIMRSLNTCITPDTVEKAYGYNAISKILGNTPSKVGAYSGQLIAELPIGLQTSSTIYEYDADGLLLGAIPHRTGSIHAACLVGCETIEGIAGESATHLTEYLNTQTAPIDPEYDYRFYMKRIGDEHGDPVPGGEWVDVTETDNYSIRHGTATWNVSLLEYSTLIRSNRSHLLLNYQKSQTGGVLFFDITYQQNIDGVYKEVPLEIPLGELDVFMNRRSLIEGLDYIVDWPRVYIINKAYLKDYDTSRQEFMVRYTGFCDKDLKRNTRHDFGFVKYGMLSRNNVFDIRDDKVIRIVVGGQLKHRDDFLYSETDSAIRTPLESNGLPYLIRDIVTPFKSITTRSYYDMREESLAIDDAISDYMTLKLPEIPIDAPNVIPKRHVLFSPFASRIAYELMVGSIANDAIRKHLSDTEILKLCSSYEYLLPYDPAWKNKDYDPTYVEIQPFIYHNVVELDLWQYQFLDRAIKLYLDRRVNISHSVRLLN